MVFHEKNYKRIENKTRPYFGSVNLFIIRNITEFFSSVPIEILIQKFGIVIRNKKQLSAYKPIIEEKDLQKQSYDSVITDDSFVELELKVSSIKFGISEYPPEVKKLLKVLTTWKTLKTSITMDNVEESQLDSIGSQPKNTLVKRSDKMKSPFNIVGQLRQPQSDICHMLIKTNIVLLALHLM